jgi:hypothetical protein
MRTASFQPGKELFGVVHERTDELLFVVEASDVAEASHRISSVMHSKVERVDGTVKIEPLADCPSHVGVYLEGFFALFSGPRIDRVRNHDQDMLQ